MPIKIPERLPAFHVLQNEGVYVMSEIIAKHQDIRPMQIGLLNLMPKKIQTEIQFARLIGATPLQIELTLIRMSEHQSKNTSQDHMEAFYTSFQNVKSRRFDGLIVTGAPIEHLNFEDVTYWQELLEIFAWTQERVHSTLAVCWGAMAMLHHFHDIAKQTLKQKAFGCFPHQVRLPASPYLRGFSDELLIPNSRWTTIANADVAAAAKLQVLIDTPASPDLGPCLIEDAAHRSLYMINHLEYDNDTLKQEYQRDRAEGIPGRMPIEIPVNYFPNDDATKQPLNRWRHHGHLLYGNWINQIYQTTPYDLNEIGKKKPASFVSEAREVSEARN